MLRRAFLGTPALLLMEVQAARAQPTQAQAALKGPDLKDELSAAELEIVNRSAMAKDLDNFFGKGFS